MVILHLPRYRFSDHALAGRKPSARITLETMKPAALRDFTGIDATLHGATKAVKISRGSRWNFRCGFPHDLTGR
jgi:hypothetical protein